MTPVATDPIVSISKPPPYTSARASVLDKIKLIQQAAIALTNANFVRFVVNIDKISARKAESVLVELTEISTAMKLALNFNEDGFEPVLHDAIRNKKPLSRIEELLSAGADPNVKNSQGQLALDLAIAKDSVEIALLLMRNKATASNQEQLERWISGKSNDAIASFLHAGYRPTCIVPDDLTLPVRVLWIHSSVNWKLALRHELAKLSNNRNLLNNFLKELVHQKRDTPLFQSMSLLVNKPEIILLGFGLSDVCPVLNKESWACLASCLSHELVTNEMLDLALLNAQNTQFCIEALEALPETKPKGCIGPFYEHYVRMIKLGLIGTLRKPTEQIIQKMAEKLEWHPREWNLLQRFYKTSAMPKRSAREIDPAIACYLQGLECLRLNNVEAEQHFRQAGLLGLPRGDFEAGRIHILNHNLPKGLPLLFKATQRGVYRAFQFLALSTNIPTAALQKTFDVDVLIRALEEYDDFPTASILRSRRAVGKLAKPNDVWMHTEILWDTPFKEEALASMNLNNCMVYPEKKHLAFLKKCAAEGLVVAIASLALRSLRYAEELFKLAEEGDQSARGFVVRMCFGGSESSPAVREHFRNTVPIQWVLAEKKIDLLTVFSTEKYEDDWDIDLLIACWDSEIRTAQVRMLQEWLPEERLAEVLDKRTVRITFGNLKYLSNLIRLLPLVAEASPSVQRFVQAYKTELFRNPFRWRNEEKLVWIPCSSEDRRVLKALDFTYLYFSYKETEKKDLLPGQQQFIDAEDHPDRADQLLQESMNAGFNPAGIILGQQLLKKKEYEKAIPLLEKAIIDEESLISRCIELVCKGELTTEEMETLVSSEELRYFFRNIHSPDLKFFRIAASIEADCNENTWRKFLKWICKQEGMPLMQKMQMHLVGHETPENIFDLPIWLNSKKWIDTVSKNSSTGKQLQLLTVDFMLQSEIEACNYLLENIAKLWIPAWVKHHCLHKEIGLEILDQAEFFWKGLRRILKHWKKTVKNQNSLRTNYFEMNVVLKNQTCLSKENRYYKKCRKICNAK